MNNTDILKIFSYTPDEQQTFGCLRSYMRWIEPSLPQLLEDHAKRDRFMLMGLFLTYRAFNHMGVTMTTDPMVLDELYPSIHVRRLRTCLKIKKRDG